VIVEAAPRVRPRVDAESILGAALAVEIQIAVNAAAPHRTLFIRPILGCLTPWILSEQRSARQIETDSANGGNELDVADCRACEDCRCDVTERRG
jgi:hypothetical protein